MIERRIVPFLDGDRVFDILLKDHSDIKRYLKYKPVYIITLCTKHARTHSIINSPKKHAHNLTKSLAKIKFMILDIFKP